MSMGHITSSASGQYLAVASYTFTRGADGARYRDSALYVSSDYGNSWTKSTIQARYWIDVEFSSDASVLIAHDQMTGKMYISKDFGMNWSFETVPLYVQKFQLV